MSTLKLTRSIVKVTNVKVPVAGQAEPICYVTVPAQRPKGIVHFVGGAFVGAAPQLSYTLLTDIIADSGYTVIQTPYPFTFKHRDLARSLHENFEECVTSLRARGQDSSVPDDVPLHGVGHSNGALMHLLIGSLCQSRTLSNVCISYNNKQISDAIPIPGFIDSSRPFLERARMLGFAPNATDVRSQWDALRQFMPTMPSQFDALGPVLSQISSAFSEIQDGTVDFDPSPQESRRIIREQYKVAKTLLLQYSDDPIDETPEMAQILMSRGVQGPRAGVQQLIIPGTHITPCGGDIPWQAGQSFTPLDAAVMAGKAIQQQGLRRTGRAVTDWLDAASAI